MGSASPLHCTDIQAPSPAAHSSQCTPPPTPRLSLQISEPFPRPSSARQGPREGVRGSGAHSPGRGHRAGCWVRAVRTLLPPPPGPSRVRPFSTVCLHSWPRPRADGEAQPQPAPYPAGWELTLGTLVVGLGMEGAWRGVPALVCISAPPPRVNVLQGSHLLSERPTSGCPAAASLLDAAQLATQRHLWSPPLMGGLHWDRGLQETWGT